MSLLNKQISEEIKHLCFGYIRNNYKDKSFALALKYVVISFFLYQQKKCIKDIIFATDPSDKDGLSFYFRSICMAFIITHGQNSLSTDVILSKFFKISICLASNKYKVYNSKRYNPIQFISNKLWKFHPLKYVYFILLTRPTVCVCETKAVLKIFITPYNQYVKNEKEGYWKQIEKLSKENALINIDLSGEQFNWKKRMEFEMISNNSITNSMKICVNKSNELWVSKNKQTESRHCCQNAMQQFSCPIALAKYKRL